MREIRSILRNPILQDFGVFILTASLASTSRGLKFLSGSTRPGLFAISAIGGAVSASYRILDGKRDGHIKKIVTQIFLSTTLAFSSSYLLRGRVSIPPKHALRVLFCAQGIILLKSIVENRYSNDSECEAIANQVVRDGLTLQKALQNNPKYTAYQFAPYLKFLSADDLKALDFTDDQIYQFLTLCINLEDLDISELGLERLPDLRNLQHLKCYSCQKLQELPDLPCLLSLKCSKCPRLSRLPEGLNPQLLHLNCSECENLEVIPDYLIGLKVLKCFGCFALKALPSDLSSLTLLDVSYCEKITALPSSLGTSVCHAPTILTFRSGVKTA